MILLQGSPPAGLGQPPELRNTGPMITFQDYPPSALRRKEHGIVSIALHVSKDGRATACDVTESSGFAVLDDATCSLIMKRARFAPAKDMAGAPVDGDHRLAISWGVDDIRPRTTMTVPLKVAAVPGDYRSPLDARLDFGATGRVVACTVTKTSGSVAADRAACAYVTSQLVIPAPKSASDKVQPIAVRYLTATLSGQAARPSAKR